MVDKALIEIVGDFLNSQNVKKLKEKILGTGKVIVLFEYTYENRWINKVCLSSDGVYNFPHLVNGDTAKMMSAGSFATTTQPRRMIDVAEIASWLAKSNSYHTVDQLRTYLYNIVTEPVFVIWPVYRDPRDKVVACA